MSEVLVCARHARRDSHCTPTPLHRSPTQSYLSSADQEVRRGTLPFFSCHSVRK